MKKFVDLHLSPPLEKMERVESMIKVSSMLNYKLIGISFPINVKAAQIDQVRNLCKSYDVDMATRIDLSPSDPKELLRLLRQVRRRFEVVSVICNSKPVARQAAKDRRVDILSFKSTERQRRFFDKSEAELAANALASLEIDMSLILSVHGFLRIRLLSILRREVATALHYDVPTIISSGAVNEFWLRAPRDYAALAALFDMPGAEALKSLCENPLRIVTRNREKLNPSFVAPGVRVVRFGDDC